MLAQFFIVRLRGSQLPVAKRERALSWLHLIPQWHCAVSAYTWHSAVKSADRTASAAELGISATGCCCRFLLFNALLSLSTHTRAHTRFTTCLQTLVIDPNRSDSELGTGCAIDSQPKSIKRKVILPRHSDSCTAVHAGKLHCLVQF